MSLFPAETTVNIPLLEEANKEHIVWQEERHGDYLMRSRYRQHMMISVMASSFREEGEWNHLWNICAPPTAKHLLWRVCRGCLPSRFIFISVVCLV
jgi:hypothetical protein